MTLCDQSTLLDLAGETTFERGREYFAQGQVIGFTDRGESAEGLVFGTRAYHTWLRRGAERVSFYCDCPVGRTSRFCKHAVALGLRWLSGAEEKGGVEACERLFEQAINLLMLGEALVADWGELAMPLGRFERLKECALSSGQWPQWRERVFEDSRQYAVEDDLSLKLAAMRIRMDPAEALALYQRLIGKLLSHKDRYSAGEARRLLRKTCRLMKRLGREEEYEEFIEELMQAFGSRRNFACAIGDATAKRNR